MYNRGSVEKWDTDSAWRQNQHKMYTLEEQGSSFSVSLYAIPEILRGREYYAHTVAAALEHNVSGPRPGTTMARPSPIPSLCTHFTRAGIEWRR